MSATPAERTATRAATSPAKHGRRRRGRPTVALAVLAAGATLAVGMTAGTASADPPEALPSAVSGDDGTYQPAMDYDTDGCYNTPAIGPDGTLNPGLKLGGDVNGSCHDESDLDNTNAYSRSKCNHDWCAYLYDFYFEKDQAALGPGSAGHRHDWEHVVVWVDQKSGKVEYVSTSRHGGYDTHAASDVPFEDGHPKVVYHKDGVSTHCFRAATDKDEPPENHKGKWLYPDLVSWDKYPDGIREKLTSADFGDATMAIKDDTFNDNLDSAKPKDIPFDPNG